MMVLAYIHIFDWSASSLDINWYFILSATYYHGAINSSATYYHVARIGQ